MTDQPLSTINDTARKRALMELAASLILCLIFIVSLFVASSFPRSARLFPQFVCYIGLIVGATNIVLCAIRMRKEAVDVAQNSLSDLQAEKTWPDVLPYFAWMAAFFIGTWVIGLLLSAIIFCLAFLTIVARAKPWLAIAMTIFCLATALLLGWALNISWPNGIIYSLLS